jgi:D-alanyl-D-alanine dipeptidase
MIKKITQKYGFYSMYFLVLFSCSSYNQNEAASDLSLDELHKNQEAESATVSNKKPDTLALRLIDLGLVDVQTINPNIRVELKYSTTDNFMKTNVYGKLNQAFLQEEVARKLSLAQQKLTATDSTLFLLVYDAVRPLWVQGKMWNLLDSIPIHQRVKFVSNPKNGSVHNYGAAVDLTICDAHGIPLDMGAGFDDPGEIAYPSKETYFLNKGEMTQAQIKNRQLLRKVMKSAGFSNLNTEWWHFNAMSRQEAKRRYKIVL